MPIGESHSAALDRWSAELLERHAELAAVTVAGTDAASGMGRLVVLVGPAGIGKTALLGAARERAVAAGLEVLRARGAEFERDAGFGVARQLFERSGAEEDTVLSRAPRGHGRQALAEAVHGLYRLTVDLASRRPIALVVDDAHWSDVPSLRFLAYLATRLEDLPVLVVVAMRPPDHEPLTSALTAAPGAIVLRPGRLSERATAQLVRRALPDAGHDLCVACHDATGGNPFFVGEVAATLRDSGATGPDEVRELVPPTVADAVAARIATLPAEARALAHAAAVLGDGVLTRHAGAVAGLNPDAAGEAADALTAAGIVEPRLPLAFVHPIVRAAVYADMPPGRRARAHGRAARLLDEEGAPPEQVAAQLLGTEPRGDAWACEQLVAIGRREAARGAADAAVAAFRRALAEPPPAARQPGLLLELGVAELMAFQLGAATAHLRAALAAADDPDLRLDAGVALASVLGGTQRPADGVDVLEQALHDSPGARPERIGEAEGELVNIARLHGPSRRRVAELSARMRRRVDAGDPVGAAELAAVAADMTMAGESAERTAALALRALSAPSRSALASDLAVPQAVRCLTVADRFDEAEAVLDAALAAAAATGSEGPTMLAMRTESLLRRGALNAALAAGRRALELAEHGWQVGVPGSAALLAQVHLERGDPDAALAVLGRPGVETTGAYTTIMAVHARGCVRLALGDAEAAAADLLRCGPLLADAGEPNPAILDWRSQAALALAASGDHERALRLATEELDLARRFGAPRAIGLALRARAAVVGGHAALDDLRDAAAVLAGSPAELARAKVLADLGEALLAAGAGDEARPLLADAAELAHRCEAAALGARVLQALHRTGARPRRLVRSGPDALTPAERRVAALAATGMANRDIAAELVVAARTVEFHLSAVYRKLGVSGRGELPEALAATGASR